MRLIIFLFAVLFSHAALSEEHTTLPANTIHNFYKALKRPQPDLQKEFESLSPYLSQKMNMLIKQALMANDSYIKRFPTDVPPFEHGNCVFYGGGDCDFSSYRLVSTLSDGTTNRSTVELELIDRNRPTEPPYRWHNTVTLIMEQGRWVITDIDYFGSKASDNLRRIIQDAK
jgi:hypothetical protein